MKTLYTKMLIKIETVVYLQHKKYREDKFDGLQPHKKMLIRFISRLLPFFSMI